MFDPLHLRDLLVWHRNALIYKGAYTCLMISMRRCRRFSFIRPEDRAFPAVMRPQVGGWRAQESNP